MVTKRTKRRNVIWTVGAGLVVIGFTWKAYQRSAAYAAPQTPSKSRSAITPTLWAENDTLGKVPGNPQHTVEDMKRLYQVVSVYKRLHGGALPDPQKNKSLVSDIILHAKEYGFTTGDQIRAFLQNPDMKYADGREHDPNPETTFPYTVTDTRADGTPKGGPKPAGTRDVLASTGMYYHRNIRLFKGDRTTTKPVGFYLVLWDDGEVQKVDWQNVRFATPTANNSGGITGPMIFLGEAGAPANTVSRAEYDEAVHRLIVKSVP